MQKQSILLRGSETHTSASKQTSPQRRLAQFTGKEEASPDSSEARRMPSDGLVQQRGDIFLLVAMGCTKDHHTVLNGQCIEVV